MDNNDFISYKISAMNEGLSTILRKYDAALDSIEPDLGLVDASFESLYKKPEELYQTTSFCLMLAMRDYLKALGKAYIAYSGHSSPPIPESCPHLFR
jgi:hypothetical protein